MSVNNRLLFWTPRILCILAILFISIFALDAFRRGMPLGAQLLAFLIHLIPSFILTGVLLIAWKWEFVGGLLFVFIGLGFTPFIFLKNFGMNHSIWISLFIVSTITFPFVITGILFLADYHKIKKSKTIRS